jgi:uncharacterized protein (TIGR03437 family)
MSLGGVSATVNNKPAAISYISTTQVNILTPLDNSVGPVPVQLTTPNGATNIATALEMQASPSFLVLDAAGHVAARHADFSPAGPASLSVPEFTFTPVKLARSSFCMPSVLVKPLRRLRVSCKARDRYQPCRWR